MNKNRLPEFQNTALRRKKEKQQQQQKNKKACCKAFCVTGKRNEGYFYVRFKLGYQTCHTFLRNL